jgi:hypothetical protein
MLIRKLTRILDGAMKRAFRKLVILFLLGWLPLQTAALPALVLLCELDPGAAPGHAAVHSHHADHDHGDSGHDHDDEGSSAADPHSCCPHLFSAVLPSLPAAAGAPTSGVVPSPLFHPELFFPEQPQPPPLAHLV